MYVPRKKIGTKKLNKIGTHNKWQRDSGPLSIKNISDYRYKRT